MKVLTIWIAFATWHLCCYRWTSCDVFPIQEISFWQCVLLTWYSPPNFGTYIFEILDFSSLIRNLMLKLGYYKASLGLNFALRGEKQWNSCSNCCSLEKYRIRRVRRWWQSRSPNVVGKSQDKIRGGQSVRKISICKRCHCLFFIMHNILTIKNQWVYLEHQLCSYSQGKLVLQRRWIELHIHVQHLVFCNEVYFFHEINMKIVFFPSWILAIGFMGISLQVWKL